MKILLYIWNMLISPRLTSQKLLEEKRVRYAAYLVLSWGIINSLGFLVSALQHDYPPPPDVLDKWIAAWGEFTMLPFLKIAPENYRLFQAIILIPLSLTIWMLMAGTAKLLSLAFKGKVSYEAYLNLMGFSYFPFLWIAAILDFIYSTFLMPYALDALDMQYGGLARGFFVWFPPFEYVLLYGLAGLYNGIAAHNAERWAVWKSVLVGFFTFAWPMVLIASLLR